MKSVVTKVRGRIDTVFYAGPKYSAGRLLTVDGDWVSFAGNVFAVENQAVVLAGAWEMHPKYGRQFKVERVEIEMPRDPEGLANYIANHPEVKGIGPARARKIVEALGDEFEGVLLNEPERVARLAGVSIEVAEGLRDVWRKAHNLNAAMTWLSAFGLTHHQVTTLVEKLGNNVMAILQDDPYRIIREIKGLGFKKVDQIARKMGTAKEHAPRIRAGVMHCVFEALEQGDCWIESEDLIDRANVLLIMDCLDSRERIEAELNGLIEQGTLECVDMGGRVVVAMPYIYRMERDLASIFERANPIAPSVTPDSDSGKIGEGLRGLNEKQQDAVTAALFSRISLIAGGAGSGKTFTISRIAEIWCGCGGEVKLAAPTGKAARRMEEACGIEAQTIHRLLGYDGKTFEKGPGNPIEAELLILDEVSMIDVPLAWQLFQAIDLERTAVVLVGDHNQLPPVGPGNILRDLIQTQVVPTTILDTCIRQAGVLKENSIAILSGEVRKTSDKRADGKCDWYLVDQFTDPSGVSCCLREMFTSVLEEKLGFDLLRDVQVLTPTHKGPIGAKTLNEELQRLVQKKRFGVEVPPHPANRRPPLFRGDKVIQTRNNYDLGVMNGAVGFLIDILSDGSYAFEFDGTLIFLKKNDENLRDIQLAYALTFHKCQGSEYPCVITVVHKAHSFMHHRNLFYTGVTRAQKTAIILGDRWGVRNCAKQVQVDNRKTFLSHFLRVNPPAQPSPRDFRHAALAVEG